MTKKSFIKTIGSKGLLADYNTEGKKLQTELTAGDNVTISDNVISSNQVFVATYGTTTYQEIKDAYDAGKICLCTRPEEAHLVFYLRYVTDSEISFSTGIIKGEIYNHATVNKENTWTNGFRRIQVRLTFDTTPTAGSTNPVTSDGIKTSLDEKQDTLTAGDNVAIANNVISSNQVFVATYGTTTYQEIKDAYDAGKICICVRTNTNIYQLVILNSTAAYFTLLHAVNDSMYSAVCYANSNAWTTGSAAYQKKLTFDTTPTAGSNNPVTSDGIKTALDSRVPAPTSTTGTQVLKCINGVIQWVNE